MTRGGNRPGAGRPTKLPKERLEHQVRLTTREKDFIEFSRLKKLDLESIKKSFLSIFIFVFICMPVNAQTLKCGIEYTVDSARVVAFENTSIRISTSEFEDHLRDKYFYTHTDYLKGDIDGIFGSKAIPFYHKNKLAYYGVQYDNDPSKKYYYALNGRLLKYEVNTFNGKYPYKTLAYDTKGRLLNINLVVSSQESYLFDNDKKLLGHWINNQFYNSKGEKEITRRL